MLKKNSTVIALLFGLASVCATATFYLLAFDNIFTVPIRWLSLICLLLVEAIGTAKALTVNRSILGFTQMITGVLHLAGALVLSIVFVNIFPLLIKQYILINLLLLIAVAVIDIALLYFNSKATDTAQNYAASACMIDECQRKAQKLLIENADSALSKGLHVIVEMLTYANRAQAALGDGELLAKIDELACLIAANELEKAEDAITQIQNMLSLRSKTAKTTGSF